MKKLDEKYVFLNGELVRARDAKVPADDRGFLYGDSVFTTMRCYRGELFHVEHYTERLNASLRSQVVGIDYGITPKDLKQNVQRLIELNGCPDAVARFEVTRGRGAGALPPADAAPTTLLTVEPYAPKESLYTEGASLIVSSVRRDPRGELGKHKLGSYFSSLLARREAAAEGADEAIISDTDGNWLECASSNLFAVIDGAIVTPDVTENLLPGIARATVFDCAAAIGFEVSLRKITAEIAERAEEWFITNSLVEVVPVARVASRRYAVPGPVTTQLIQAYRNVVGSKTARTWGL